MTSVHELASIVNEGEQLLAPVAHRADDDEQAGSVLLEARLHVDPVGPGVHQLTIGEITPSPLLPFELPGGLEARGPRSSTTVLREWQERQYARRLLRASVPPRRRERMWSTTEVRAPQGRS